MVGYGPCSWQRSDKERKEVAKKSGSERYAGGGRRSPWSPKKAWSLTGRMCLSPWEQRGQVSQHTGGRFADAAQQSLRCGRDLAHDSVEQRWRDCVPFQGACFSSQSGVCDLARNDGWVGRLAVRSESSLSHLFSLSHPLPGGLRRGGYFAVCRGQG